MFFRFTDLYLGFFDFAGKIDGFTNCILTGVYIEMIWKDVKLFQYCSQGFRFINVFHRTFLQVENFMDFWYLISWFHDFFKSFWFFFWSNYSFIFEEKLSFFQIGWYLSIFKGFFFQCSKIQNATLLKHFFGGVWIWKQKNSKRHFRYRFKRSGIQNLYDDIKKRRLELKSSSVLFISPSKKLWKFEFWFSCPNSLAIKIEKPVKLAETFSVISCFFWLN